MVTTVNGPAVRTNSGWEANSEFSCLTRIKVCSPTSLLIHKSEKAFSAASSFLSNSDPSASFQMPCKHLSRPSRCESMCGFVSKGALHLVSPELGMPNVRSETRRALRTDAWICFLPIGSCQSSSCTETVLQPEDLVAELFIATQWKLLGGLPLFFWIPAGMHHASRWRRAHCASCSVNCHIASHPSKSAPTQPSRRQRRVEHV